MKSDKRNEKSLIVILRDFLLKEEVKTQEEICRVLNNRGYDVSQTKVSRLLRSLGVVKVKNEYGDVVYWLPKELPPPELSKTISNLIVSVSANENMIVVDTASGAAQLVARILDYRSNEDDILGTIAGDDTIFIVPKSVKNIKRALEKIKTLLGF